ncbi:calcium-binding protein [Agrobacterium deltaense]|uniref:calcium-binding protein n=1 Tax=Agrobacterium deltaense TaxID=1183412 RepID=UPI003D99E170
MLLKNALGSYRGVDTVTLADGTVWNWATMRVMLLAQASTAASDTIVGFDGHDTINAGAGNDAIDGGVGHDAINGGRGNDVINGGEGSDSYVYARSDGNDTISEGS